MEQYLAESSIILNRFRCAFQKVADLTLSITEILIFLHSLTEINDVLIEIPATD
jgi:hypothetical protein